MHQLILGTCPLNKETKNTFTLIRGNKVPNKGGKNAMPEKIICIKTECMTRPGRFDVGNCGRVMHPV